VKETRFIRSLIGIVPAFFIYAVIACMIGRFVFGIPHGQLGVVVSVPLVVGFILTRVLMTVVPDTPLKPAERTVFEWIGVAVFAYSAFASIVMSVSAPVFWILGMSDIARNSLSLSGTALGVSVLAAVCIILAVVNKSVSLLRLVKIVAMLAAIVFWKTLQLETEGPRRHVSMAS
jgi:hypothetical protein